MILVVSFAYIKGIPGDHVDYIIDARTFNNPKATARIIEKNGRDQRFKNLLFSDKNNKVMLGEARSYANRLAEKYDNFGIGVGCLNGKYRSVAVAEHIATSLKKKGYEVNLFHLGLSASLKYVAGRWI